MEKSYGLTSMGLWSRRADIAQIVGTDKRLVLALGPTVKPCDVYVGWGDKPSGRRARKLASKYGKKTLFLEDGFLCSFRPGKKEVRHSYMVDEVGLHFDRLGSSDLRSAIELNRFDPIELAQARDCMDEIRKCRISKYNNRQALDTTTKVASLSSPYILIIDQVEGDSSLPNDIAIEKLYHQMFNTALAQYPDIAVAIRAHPANDSSNSIMIAAQKSGLACIKCPDCNIWDAIENATAVMTISSHVGFEALMAGKKVHTFGAPFYAGWGLTDDHYIEPEFGPARSLECLFFAAYIKTSRYIDVHTGYLCNIEKATKQITYIRDARIENGTRIHTVQFSLWRRWALSPFLQGINGAPMHHKALASAVTHAKRDGGKIALWGANTPSPDNLTFVRLEDGFIRSNGLGVDLHAPYSICRDNAFLYFDNRGESRLREILRQTELDSDLLNRAVNIRQMLIDGQVTKYNSRSKSKRMLSPPSVDKLKILVTGQVADDASIRFSNSKVTRSDELVTETRKKYPDAFIVYKVHPDVATGLRSGQSSSSDADLVISDGDILEWIDWADRVETISSLSGFEALLRGKKVGVYGNPFFAGIGLTDDYNPETITIQNKSIDELVAASLILYPSYIHPASLLPCSPEELIAHLICHKNVKRSNSIVTSVRRSLTKVIKFVLQR